VRLLRGGTTDRPSLRVAKDLGATGFHQALCLATLLEAHGAASNQLGPDQVNVSHFIVFKMHGLTSGWLGPRGLDPKSGAEDASDSVQTHKHIIIPLRCRPPEGWLAAPGTAPEGAIGPNPNFSQPETLGCLAPCSCDLFASLPFIKRHTGEGMGKELAYPLTLTSQL
jgi:hypothetical protein